MRVISLTRVVSLSSWWSVIRVVSLSLIRVVSLSLIRGLSLSHQGGLYHQGGLSHQGAPQVVTHQGGLSAR